MSNSTSTDSNSFVKHFVFSMLIVNAVISILASGFNLFIILTFMKTASLRTPSNLLLLGLAISDFSAGFFAEPVTCALLNAFMTDNTALYNTLSPVQELIFYILAPVSFYTLTAITTDRFLAIYIHLKYQLIITKKCYRILLVFIWGFGLAWSLCFVLLKKHYVVRIINIAIFILLILFNAGLLVKISKEIHRHSAQINALYQATVQTLNMPRYKRSVSTIYYVIAVFLLCYLPQASVALVKVLHPGLDARIHFTITETLVMINSVVNPIIYCWRIPDIRIAARQILQL